VIASDDHDVSELTNRKGNPVSSGNTIMTAKKKSKGGATLPRRTASPVVKSAAPSSVRLSWKLNERMKRLSHVSHYSFNQLVEFMLEGCCGLLEDDSIGIDAVPKQLRTVKFAVTERGDITSIPLAPQPGEA